MRYEDTTAALVLIALMALVITLALMCKDALFVESAPRPALICRTNDGHSGLCRDFEDWSEDV